MNFRDQFHLPVDASGHPLAYLCGNSLGLQPKRVATLVSEELEDWQRLAVEGHFQARRPWMPYHEFVREPLARLVGAQPDEVVAMNALTVNLHLMMVSFYRPSGTRTKIVIERGAFPSDRHAVVSQLRFHGIDPADGLVELEPREGEATLREEDIEAMFARLGETIALVLLPGVQYYTGQFVDIKRLTAAAHAQGARVGVDLAHAAGNVPLRLHDWGPDFAVWCHYKYCNAGPGAVGGCFVHARHAESFDLPRFAGWWGHDQSTRFRMGPEFVPQRGADGWQVSNPPILSLAPLLASLEIFDAAGGVEGLRPHSEKLTGMLERLLERRAGDVVEILTPREPARRGCQLSLRIRGGNGKRVHDALGKRGIVCDWREPDVIRAAPTPLYNTSEEIERFVAALIEAVL
ncbi:MAG: kynureninase [Gammaproteobacteria bacterium]